jgi:flavin-binding protein dodecin
LIRKNLNNINSNPSNYIMTDVAKIIEIVGSSSQGWEDAVQVALTEAGKTIKGITGVEVIDMTGKVDPSTGKINLYKVTVKIAFGVQHS